MIYHANANNCKKAGVAIVRLDKVDFQNKKMIVDKEGHYIMIKGLLCKEDITILNVYVPNKKSLKTRGAKTDRIEKRNRKIQNYSWRLQYASQ